MKEQKWFDEDNTEIKYNLKDLKWYKTSKGFFPFIENEKGTKIKLLPTGKIAILSLMEEKAPIAPIDKIKVNYYKNYEKALKKITKQNGKVCTSLEVICGYFYQDRNPEHVKIWINETAQTIYQIRGMTSYMNNSLERENKIEKNCKNY